MLHQDEALKALVARFKESPGTGFLELSAGLLARGHAAEALRIAEHGLQVAPESADGRVERAAALLALGRPRVAYVELCRALALEPGHRRGMRLLGKAFVDAGAPGRAAELLSRRLGDRVAEAEKRPPKPPVPDLGEIVPPPLPPRLPDLFSDLTKDLGLGLGAAVPDAPQRRPEVTQIIRRKVVPRPPRSASELVAIDGPIVDTTQPGQVVETQVEEIPLQAKEVAPLFAEPTPHFASLALDDEPLFQEHMPFSVQPVDAEWDERDTAADHKDTVVDEIEASNAPLEALAPFLPPAALSAPLEPQTDPGRPFGIPHADTSPMVPLHDFGARSMDRGVDRSAAPTLPSAPIPPGLAIPPADTKPLISRSDATLEVLKPKSIADLELPDRTDWDKKDLPLVEKNRPGRGRLEVVVPPLPRQRLLLALVAGILMVVYFFGLAWVLWDRVGVWFPGGLKGSGAQSADVAPKEARAERANEP